jgi:hypothetical protein
MNGTNRCAPLRLKQTYPLAPERIFRRADLRHRDYTKCIDAWDGQTLVVDTTNFSPNSNYMGSAENLHLVERFTRIAPDEIRYEVTVDDPTVWTRPWTAVVRLRRTDEVLRVRLRRGNPEVFLCELCAFA